MAGYMGMTQRVLRPTSLDAQWLQQNAQAGTDRFRNNNFFPLQAAQIADGEGGTNDGSVIAPNQAAFFANGGKKPQSAADAYKQAYQQYTKDFDSRYQGTLSEYDARKNQSLDFVLGKDPSAPGNPVDRISYYEQTHPGEKFDFNQRMQLAKLYSDLSSEKPRVMESRNDVPPDLNQLIDLEKTRGAGSTEGMQAPAVAPRFGVPMGQPGGVADPVDYGGPGQRPLAYRNGQVVDAMGGQPAAGPAIMSPAQAGLARRAKIAAIYGRGVQSASVPAAANATTATPISRPVAVQPFTMPVPTANPGAIRSAALGRLRVPSFAEVYRRSPPTTTRALLASN